MIYRPHDYQIQATRFIEDHPVAAVFLECGLGKTAITLSAIKDLMHEILYGAECDGCLAQSAFEEYGCDGVILNESCRLDLVVMWSVYH